jgi:hypothetical protein
MYRGSEAVVLRFLRPGVRSARFTRRVEEEKDDSQEGRKDGRI